MASQSSKPGVIKTIKNMNFDEIIYNIHMMKKFQLLLFIISITFCFFFIIFVLLIIPCNWADSSLKLEMDNRKSFWTETIFTDIELKGKPSLIEFNKKLLRLVFIARGSIFNSQSVPPRTERFPSGGGGLFQMDTITGKEMWRKRLEPLPDKVDCTLLNKHYEGDSEVFCIVVASNGNLLGVVSSKQHKGELIWKQTRGHPELNTTKLFNKNDIVYVEFPVIIPDCNSDGVNELALVQQINNTPSITIASGKSGRPMISNIYNENCTKITDLILSYDVSLVYICRRNSGVDSLEKVQIKRILNCTGDWIPDSVYQTKREHDKSDDNKYSLTAGNYILNLTNKDSSKNCPAECNVFLIIINSFGDKIWSKQYNQSYAMNPVSFELRNNIYGFIVKLWILTKETNDEKRLSSIEKIKHIEEKILIISYNSSRIEDFHVKYLSRKQIIQVCEKNLKCQPDINYQKQSMDVIDVNNNGYRDLITIMVTFRLINTPSQFILNDKHSLQLISKVNTYPIEKLIIHNFEIVPSKIEMVYLSMWSEQC
ncbi:uncharacterized protein LOC126899801 isoform X2 [Daktulosphaira vitifoliae]|uniref:uncharacterized protein LOC126899801 isoform X2 n=1 Tax=Daktulosphaira vitifoliae TaxID=58002 RepID=UPI0021A9B0ED|nr:uncharacterized protein LOC126899801 isoform X2 [Daktulosphaira vitifoliae]